MGGAEECPHALLVSGNGQGHISGSMLLAKALAALGFNVSFVYFSSYYAKLKASNRLVLPYSSHTTTAHEPSSQTKASDGHYSNGNRISMNGRNDAHEGAADFAHPASTTMIRDGSTSHGLIDIHVVDDGFAPGDIDNPFFATPTMKESLFNLILELRERGTTPTCLVSDSFVPWTLHVANRAGIPRIDFWTSNAMSYLIISSVPSLYSQGILPEKGSSTQWKRETPLMLDHIPGLAPISSEMYSPHLRFADHPAHSLVSFFCEIASCVKYGERILIHTMQDIEADAFRAFEVAGIPAYGIGPLLHYAEKSREDTPAPSQAEGKSGVPQVNGQVDCFSWLNTKAESSVIYIAFGSMASLSAEEIQELACGLEASGSPFLWALRQESLGGAELTQVLPKGFRERTSERGLIMGWALQVEVLAHRAIGGFLTHCGWNSSFESLWEGVPLLCCPRFAEQRLNSHYMCDVWGVGLELERTDTGGLDRRFVELGVKALMQEESGHNARAKAQEMMQLARKTCQPGGQSYSNLQKFYDDMKVLCSKPMSHTSSK